MTDLNIPRSFAHRTGYVLFITGAVLASGCFATLKDRDELNAKIIHLSSTVDKAQRKNDDAMAKSEEERDDQRAEQEAQVKKIDAKIKEVNEALEGLRKQAGRTGADLGVQLEAEEKEIARLRGIIEESQAKSAAMEQSSSQMQTDFQTRIAALEKRASDNDAQAKSAAEQKKKEDALPSEPSDFYKLAKKKFDDGDMPGSRDLFTKFLSKWKNDDLSDNARYWIGETYFEEKDFKRSGQEFQKVIADYPKSDKAPDAALMLANSFIELNLIDDGKAFLQNVIDTYPKSGAARQAEKKLSELKKRKR